MYYTIEYDYADARHPALYQKFSNPIDNKENNFEIGIIEAGINNRFKNLPGGEGLEFFDIRLDAPIYIPLLDDELINVRAIADSLTLGFTESDDLDIARSVKVNYDEERFPERIRLTKLNNWNGLEIISGLRMKNFLGLHHLTGPLDDRGQSIWAFPLPYRNFQKIHISTNIIDRNTYIDNEYFPILDSFRTYFPEQGGSTGNLNTFYRFKEPRYLSINSTYLEDINIVFRDESGRPIRPVTSSYMYVLLHIRKKYIL